IEKGWTPPDGGDLSVDRKRRSKSARRRAGGKRERLNPSIRIDLRIGHRFRVAVDQTAWHACVLKGGEPIGGIARPEHRAQDVREFGLILRAFAYGDKTRVRREF